jgi:hypothetical protein
MPFPIYDLQALATSNLGLQRILVYGVEIVNITILFYGQQHDKFVLTVKHSQSILAFVI